jgi:hypothetical protein
MNNLIDLMNATGTTLIELSKETGIPISNVRRLMTLDDLSGIYKTTQKKLADYFEITVNQLINGGTKMKNKILETEIRKHAEALAVALRKYTDVPIYFHLSVMTRNNVTDEPDTPDYYDFVIHELDDDFGEIKNMTSKALLIHYYYDEDELIRKTTPFYSNERNENDI